MRRESLCKIDHFRESINILISKALQCHIPSHLLALDIAIRAMITAKVV